MATQGNQTQFEHPKNLILGSDGHFLFVCDADTSRPLTEDGLVEVLRRYHVHNPMKELLRRAARDEVGDNWRGEVRAFMDRHKM